MNKNTRDRLLDKYIGTLQELRRDVENLQTELASDFEDKSETWQGSEKGEAENERVESVQSAIDLMDEAIDALEGGKVDE